MYYIETTAQRGAAEIRDEHGFTSLKQASAAARSRIQETEAMRVCVVTGGNVLRELYWRTATNDGIEHIDQQSNYELISL